MEDVEEVELPAVSDSDRADAEALKDKANTLFQGMLITNDIYFKAIF